MTFAAVIHYSPDSAKIAAVRPVHREYCAELLQRGQYVMGGPFPDDSGALIVYEADSKEAVEALMRNDPFGQQGIFVSWTIYPWKIVMANAKLLPV
jgi:uncharacterized protein YciI